MADQTRSKAGGNQPISRHPLFPAIVALWFGALFGLVSAVIEPALIERAVVATGIDSVIPMASPPLGATARILLALAMTGLGGVIGALVARRIARPQAETPGRRRRAASMVESSAPAALPASATAPAPSARKSTRAAAILNVAEFDLGDYMEEAKDSAAAQESPRADLHQELEAAPLAPALTDSPAAEPEQQEWLDEEPAAPAPESASCPGPSEEIPIEGRGALSNPLFESYSRQISARAVRVADESDHGNDDLGGDAAAPAESDAEIGRWQEEGDRGNAAGRIATAELDALSQVELLERLALAMARRRDEIARAAASGVPEPLEVLESLELREPLEVVETAGIEPEPEPCLEPEPEPEPQVSAPITFQPLRFETPRLETAPAPAESEPEIEIEADAPNPEIGPEISPESPRVPAALRPVAYNAHDEDDALPGYIPPRHIGIAPEANNADALHAPSISYDEEAFEGEEEEDGDVLNEGYSSLLDLSRPARPFPRIEDPDEPDADGEVQPWGIFPGENARDPDTSSDCGSPAAGRLPSNASARPFDAPEGHGPDETERALRAALATLQRMSGAA